MLYFSLMERTNDTAEARAAARRATWNGALVQTAEDRPPTGATVAERLEMLAEASQRAWALTGLEIPQWERTTMPGRVIRPAEGP